MSESGISNEQIAKELLFLRFAQVLVNEEYKAGKFKIPVHLAMGHEAIAVALQHVLDDGDKLVLTHRNIEFNLVRAGKLRPVLDEYFLKDSGIMGGHLGSMNLNNPSCGIIYTSSILGNNFPVATGIAMAHKIRGEQYATFVLGGDGSIEEGSFYESLLNSKSWNLPIVFLIENNEWSLGTHISERRHPLNLEKMAESLAISYIKLRGNHVHQYMESFMDAKERSLKEGGPICIEVMVKTLGDRYAEDGHYINYHAGPSPVVDINKLAAIGGVLRENEDDPLFVILQELGRDKFLKISSEALSNLQKELV